MIKITDTFFDKLGEIVCVTRIEKPNRSTIIYGMYCTGKHADSKLEFGFTLDYVMNQLNENKQEAERATPMRKLTKDDLRLREAGAHHYVVLNHYSWSKYVAEVFFSTGEHWQFAYANGIRELHQNLTEKLGHHKSSVLINVYTSDSKLAYVSPKHTAKLIKQKKTSKELYSMLKDVYYTHQLSKSA